MDIVSHGLWGGIAFGRTNRRSFGLAFSFGMLPDLVPFGPFYIAVLLGLAQRPHFGSEPPDPLLFPDYVHRTYSVTHSLVIFLLVFTLLWMLFRRPIWESFAWGLHILFDIFTHSFRFFPTPFLWPVSDYKFNGWHWGRSEIFIPNVVLLVLFYIWFLYRRRRVRKGPTEAFSRR